MSRYASLYRGWVDICPKMLITQTTIRAALWKMHEQARAQGTIFMPPPPSSIGMVEGILAR